MNTTFGERVKARRKELDLSVSELARRAGVTQPTLWRIEEGQEPKLGAAAAIALALGKPLDELAGLNRSAAKNSSRKRRQAPA